MDTTNHKAAYSLSTQELEEYFASDRMMSMVYKNFKLGSDIEVTLSGGPEEHTVLYMIWAESGLILFEVEVLEDGSLKGEVINSDKSKILYTSPEDIEKKLRDSEPRTTKDLCESVSKYGMDYINTYLEVKYLDSVKEYFERVCGVPATSLYKDAGKSEYCVLIKFSGGQEEVSFFLKDSDGGEYFFNFLLNEDLTVNKKSIEYLLPED